MTKQLLLEVWKNEGRENSARLYKNFIKEDYIVNRLRTVCPGVENITGATVTRLKLNGKVKIGKGVYTIYLYSEIKHPEKIQEYKDYRLSQLPTFVEYLLAMRERYCPDLVQAKKEFKNEVKNAYVIEYLARELIKLQAMETQVLMWDNLVGKEWSIIDDIIAGSNRAITSVEIHYTVLQYLDRLQTDIVVQTSFGVVSSTDQISNLCENTKNKHTARWCREYAKEIRNLEENKDYR